MRIHEINAREYGVDARVAVVEEKKDALYLSGLIFAPEHEVLDNRAITTLYVLNEKGKEMYNYDYFIVTYDMDLLLSDSMGKAIIAHELGHIEHPVVNNDYSDIEAGLRAEKGADSHAVSLGYGEDLHRFLSLVHKQFKCLGAEEAQLRLLTERMEEIEKWISSSCR